MADRKEVNHEQVKKLMQFKPTLRTTAGYFDVSEDTIERRIREWEDCTFAEFRDKHMAGVRVRLVQKALELALTKECRTMLIFSLKNIAKWSDRQDVEVSSNEEGVVNITYNVDKK